MDNQNGGQRILVVDDRPSNIQVTGLILRKKGFLISIAGSGEQALKSIEQDPPDLVLLDVLMPDMDGFEICGHLKGNPGTREIPVIFMSALTEAVDKVEGYRVGGADYVAKPVEPEELLAKIDTHLRLKTLQKEVEDMKAKNEALQREVKMLKDKQGGRS